MKRQIKLVIFDLDGTLVDAYQAVSIGLNNSLKQLNYPQADDQAIKRSVGWGERSLMEAFVKPEDLDTIQAFYREEHKKALLVGTKFLPDAQKLLYELKEKGYQLAIATNRPSWSTSIIIKYLEIYDLFDYILSADMLDTPKPAPDILWQLLHKFSVTEEEVLYVGDMTVDVETGSRAGIKTVVVLTGSSSKEEFEAFKPYRIINNVYGVMDVLEEVNLMV